MKKIIMVLLVVINLLGADIQSEIKLVPDSSEKTSYSGLGKLFNNKVIVLNLQNEEQTFGSFIDNEWIDNYICKNKNMKNMVRISNAKIVLIFSDKIKVYHNFSCLK